MRVQLQASEIYIPALQDHPNGSVVESEGQKSHAAEDHVLQLCHFRRKFFTQRGLEGMFAAQQHIISAKSKGTAIHATQLPFGGLFCLMGQTLQKLRGHPMSTEYLWNLSCL